MNGKELRYLWLKKSGFGVEIKEERRKGTISGTKC